MALGKLVLTILCAHVVLQAQSFSVAGRKVQVHGFAAQGFVYSDKNNYLTMKTSEGSFSFTDGGFNLSTAVTDKFRVGAQAYARNIGQLGEGHVTLDWAFADYRVKNWFGVRAGKIKTVLGLHNDTQDIDALHTWAILPQSMYPVDLRSLTIAHNGADAYGDVTFERMGQVSYVAYAGTTPKDKTSGLYYGMEKRNIFLSDDSGRLLGADLRWNAPVNGLLIGASALKQNTTAEGTIFSGGRYQPYSEKSRANSTLTYYVQYSFRNLRLDGEYRRNNTELTGNNIPTKRRNRDARGWYTSAAYRFHKRLELGTYYSQFIPNWREADFSLPENHISDGVATVRLDLSKRWVLKIEGHMMSGYGATTSFRGFYKADQPGGEPQPKTNMLVVRTGFSF